MTVRHPILLLLLLALLCSALVQAPQAATAITYDRSIGVALNGIQIFDKANEAWTWTFGREPGAKLLRSDRGDGLIEGTARFNFRSEMLTGREETMGVVQYRVVIRTTAGECRVVVSELTHTGNRNTAKGGIHVGLLRRGEDAVDHVRGMSRSNAKRLHDELTAQSDTRVTALLRAFEGRMRAGSAP
ncbi:MAG: hypothetical protein JNM31_12475 [Flavobacteriales bacterium]|nr:hypothetical protein [Flavobacteriales bacterium]